MLYDSNIDRSEGEPIVNTSTKILPVGYEQTGEIDLKKNKRLAIFLNIFALFVFVFSFILLSNFILLVRPNPMGFSMTISLDTMVILIGLLIMLIIIHELVHGLFFWAFTRSKPVFAIHVSYAYAGAPDWYIPARQFALNTIGPLIIIDVVGVLLMLLVPESWIIVILILVAMNTGGSMGDLLVLKHIFKLSPTSFVNDVGYAVTFYEPKKPRPPKNQQKKK